MNILQRIAGAFKAQPKKGKFVLWPTWREGAARWTLTNLQSLIDEGFEANAVVYSAVMYKARSFSQVPLLAYDNDGELLPPAAPLSKLLARPHPHFSWLEMSMQLSVFFGLFGEAYVYGPRRRSSELPERLYVLRPDRVRHVFRNQELIGYVYVPAGYTEGMPIVVEDMMHVALPNPNDPFAGFGKGFAPLMVARKSLEVDNAATDFLKLFFEHGALPPGILKFDSMLSDDMVSQAQERWNDIYGGYRQWTQPAVLDSGGDYQKIGLTIQELDMGALDARNEARVTMVFGVPLTLLEMRPGVTDSTYSNTEQAYESFWRDTMKWEIAAFETEWQFFLGGEWGTVRYNLDDIDALRKLRNETADRMMRAFELSLVDTDAVRAALGQPADPRGARFLYRPGNELLPPNALPSTALPAPPQPPALPAPTADTEKRRARGEVKEDARPFAEKMAIAKRIDTTAASFEPDAQRAVRRVFEAHRRALLAILSENKSAAYAERKSVVWQFVLLDALEWVRTAGKEEWRSTLIPVLEATILAQGEHLNATFGMSFDVRNLLAEEWFTTYKLQFTDPITATTAETLTDMFMQALAEGYSIRDMERALETLFEQWTNGGVVDPTDRYFAERRLPPWRLEVIARTETMRASNAGSYHLYRDWGVTKKEWLAARDDRTRDSHQVGATYGLPLVVGIDEPFRIGGSLLQYPGDPSAPLKETANCRCTVLPVME